MRYILPLAIAAALFTAGCTGAEVKKETFRLLPEERAAYEAYTNPNAVLYEEPEQADMLDPSGKYIYLGWLAQDGILPDNPYRDTKWNPYRESNDPDVRKIDADMWWIMARRKERLEQRRQAEASRPRIISY